MRRAEPFGRSAIVACLLLLLAVIIGAPPGFTGGARRVAGSGQPMRWNNATAVTYNVDQGMLGLLTNAQANALVADSFARWQDVPLADLTFTAGAALAADVDAVGLPGSNPAHWANFWKKDGDGLFPVIYDEDGSVVDDMFGIGARFTLLGAATIDDPISLGGTITGASMVINGAFLDGLGPPGSPPDAASQLAFQATIVHEAGHTLNLDHSLVNHDLASDFDPDNDVFVPTMCPLTVQDEEAIVSPNPDDEASLLGLYPGPSVATSRWKLSGVVSSAGTAFQGAQVIVRRATDPLLYAYEAISGARYFPCNVGGSCYPCDPFGSPCSPAPTPNRGAYVVDGMEPGAYTVCVEQLDRRISLENGTFIGPLPTPAILPGPEECWNSSESGNPSIEDPDDAGTLNPAGGDDLGGIDIVLSDLPASDPFEPNDSFGSATLLPGLILSAPRDTVGAVLGAGDLDFYQVGVVAGHIYQIDIDASEIGSTHDPILGLYDAAMLPIATYDDGVDPDSAMVTPDPAVTWKATFTGSLHLVVGSYPDADLDGAGGATIGPYWLRVIHDQDSDGDGVIDRNDAFPLDAADDMDGDGVSSHLDTCPLVADPAQTDTDGDGHGDACDTSQVLMIQPSSAVMAYESNVVGARMGSSLAGNLDVNNDGFGDLLIGLPDLSDPNGNVGAFELRFGTPSGRSAGVIYRETGFSAPAALGFSVDGVGDIDCDGFDDFIAGEPARRCFDIALGEIEFTGYTYAPGSCYAVDAGTVRLGQSVGGAGDVNGDGARDVVVGDPNHPAGGTARGKAYVLLSSPAPSCGPPDTTADWVAAGSQDNALFGTSTRGAGNVNGDLYADILVGAPGDGSGEIGEGRVFLYLGSSSGPSATPDWTAESDEAGAGLGSWVAGLGDVNGDGYDDVAAGAPFFNGAGTDRGRVLVFHGSASGLPTTPSLTLDGGEDNGHYGATIAGLGDLNDDGYDDVAVGASDEDSGGIDRGRAYVYLGSASGLLAAQPIILSGVQESTRFGSAVAGGDTNGDGLADLLVGVKDYDGGQTDEGRIFIYLGSRGSDRDGDGVIDEEDNCWDLYNPTQQDTDTAAGPDAICTNFDDSFVLYGPDNLCGTADDVVGDRIGDACASWPLIAPFTALGLRSNSVAWGDYDGDGDLDVWLGGVATGTLASERLLRNDGNGAFTEVTPSAMNARWSFGAWADSDNDGDLDLWSIHSTTGSRLLVNNGGGTFTAATLPTLSNPQWMNWVDDDLDGDLDVYVAAGATGGRLFRNGGSNSFTLVSPSGGPEVLDHSRAVWGDFDQDGDQDLFTGHTSLGSLNCQRFRNDGSGVFTSVSFPTPMSCSAIDLGDYDNDGDLDLIEGFQVLRNQNGSSFTLLGILDGTLVPRWGDLDNDGDLDLARGSMHRNDGGDLFRRSDEAATRSYFSTFLALADYDGDGRLDQFLPSVLTTNVRSRIARNQTDNDNHWLEVDLEGTSSNRSAIGARVRAVTGATARVREVVSGAVTGPLRLHFGLGEARVVDLLEIRWPSGGVQTFTDLAVDQLVSIQEVDAASPSVVSSSPPDGAIDVNLYTDVVVRMSEAIDPRSADSRSVSLSREGVKVPASVRISSDGRTLTVDPDAPLDPDADYTLTLSAELRDLSGNPAVPFASGFDTGDATASLPLSATVIGTTQTGAAVGGANQDDGQGASAAAVGNVNGDGAADLVVGAPNTDDGSNVDAGAASLVFGQTELQSTSGGFLSLKYVGEGTAQFAGKAVSAAGDINGDSLADFLVGAPLASPNGAGSGKAYLLFGNAGMSALAPATFGLGSLPGCGSPATCGVIFEGEAAADQAGLALAAAGDINDDGFPDILIGAPGASPAGRAGAGKIYLVYGPLATPGIIPLSTIGVTQPGIVFHGENPGDAAGAALSGWDQFSGDGIDDLLIGAPLGDSLDDFGATRTDCGLTYAIHGGAVNLAPFPLSPATVDLRRVASGQPDQVSGIVFIGSSTGSEIGRSITGEVDIDGDDQPDIIMGGDGEAWIIPGDDPKTKSGSSTLDPRTTIIADGLLRQGSSIDVMLELGATVLTPGFEGNVGPLAVGAAGDVNGDGVEDLIIGAPEADLPGKIDAGKAYVVFGSVTFPQGELLLSDIGTIIPGVVVEGAEAGDQLGSSVGGGFDLNGDGYEDVLVGAPLADTQASTPEHAGEVYILSPLPAGEVPLLTVDYVTPFTGPVLLEWEPADRAVTYNVYRGLASQLLPAGVLRSSDMTQLACGTNASSDADALPDLPDAANPPLHDAFFYLITASNLFGESLLGTSHEAPARIHDGQCP